VILQNPSSNSPSNIFRLSSRVQRLRSTAIEIRKSYYGAGLAAALTVGVGTGVTVGTGVAETAGTLFIIGAGVDTGTLGNVSLSGRLPVRTPGVGLVVGTVVVPVWPVVLVCAETNDSVITHDATIAK
jgi:hypothetical protein